jgi:hypothetical protein
LLITWSNAAADLARLRGAKTKIVTLMYPITFEHKIKTYVSDLIVVVVVVVVVVRREQTIDRRRSMAEARF